MASVFMSVFLILCCIVVGIQGNSLLRRWTYREEDGTEVQVIPAALLHKRDQSRDLERNKRCRCYCRRIWEDEYTCCECGDTTCFPRSARVTLENGDVTTIENLKPGNRVLTASLDGSVHPTTFLGYLDHRRDVISLYYNIITASGAQLTLSGSHVLYASADNNTSHVPRYASELRIGEYVMTKHDDHTVVSMVTHITLKGMKGAYVPLTESGTILVDDVLTSCYASFPHDVAHVAMSPLRWFPSLATLGPDDGIHPYVSFVKYLGRVVLPSKWLFSVQAQHDVSTSVDEHLGHVGHNPPLLVADMKHSEL